MFFRFYFTPPSTLALYRSLPGHHHYHLTHVTHAQLLLRIPLSLGGVSISVGVYAPLLRAMKASGVNIDRRTNKEVSQHKEFVDRATGQQLFPGDIAFKQVDQLMA